MEVTVGSGAFMKNIEDATKLSETMIGIGNLADKETICILTNESIIRIFNGKFFKSYRGS